MLSVIIPVYKVEQYIEKCARSLFEQSMRSGIEYLFINDCTPDNSIEVLKKVLEDYPERAPQVRILHNEQNLSTAGTRSRGMQEARGDYVVFCDSDDWVDTDMYETMYAEAKRQDADIVVCDYIRHTTSGLEFICYDYQEKPVDCIRHLYDHEIFPFSSLWNKLIRRQILVNHDCYPYEGINYSEDLNILVRVFCYAHSLVHIKRFFYHLNRLNESSITKTQKDKDLKSIWLSQKKNVDLMAAFLLTLPEADSFRYTINCLKFYTKSWFRDIMSDKEYYYTWPECYCDILHFKTTPLKGRLLQCVAYSNYFFFMLFSKIMR